MSCQSGRLRALNYLLSRNEQWQERWKQTNEWFVESIGHSSSFQREWQERKSRIERASSKCKINDRHASWCLIQGCEAHFCDFYWRAWSQSEWELSLKLQVHYWLPKPPPIHFSLQGLYGSLHMTFVSWIQTELHVVSLALFLGDMEPGLVTWQSPHQLHI